MFERNKALDLIEQAMETDPYCPICHAPTVIDDEDGLIMLRCSSVTEAHGFFARLGATLMPHLRREVVDLDRASPRERAHLTSSLAYPGAGCPWRPHVQRIVGRHRLADGPPLVIGTMAVDRGEPGSRRTNQEGGC